MNIVKLLTDLSSACCLLLTEKNSDTIVINKAALMKTKYSHSFITKQDTVQTWIFNGFRFPLKGNNNCSRTFNKTQTKNTDDNNYYNLAHKTSCRNRMLFGWPKHGKFDLGGLEAYWISKSFRVWCFIHAGWLTKSQ